MKAELIVGWGRAVVIAVVLGGSLGSAQPGLAASAAQYREQGLRYRQQGQFAEAIVAFQQSVKLEPENLSGRVLLGWTLHLAGQDQEAADVLKQTTQIDPLYVPAFNALGIIYLMNSDLLPAVMVHTWARLLEPENEVAYYNLSLAFQRLQHYDWAIDAAKQAVALEPNNPHPLVALSIAHWGKGESAMAQQAYRQAMRLDLRYRSSEFLAALEQAGFSPEQIATSRQILTAASD
jgi:Flp pilus assembly protein TadD